MSNVSLEEESARKLLAVRVWSEGWLAKLLLSPWTAALTHHHINQHFLCHCLKAGALNQKIQILEQNIPETNLQQEVGWEWGAQTFTGEGEPARGTFVPSPLPASPVSSQPWLLSAPVRQDWLCAFAMDLEEMQNPQHQGPVQQFWQQALKKNSTSQSPPSRWGNDDLWNRSDQKPSRIQFFS